MFEKFINVKILAIICLTRNMIKQKLYEKDLDIHVVCYVKPCKIRSNAIFYISVAFQLLNPIFFNSACKLKIKM